jgi:hypothetical protein
MIRTVPVTGKMSDHFCYLGVSGVYVHENCCLGVQRHPLTYVRRRRFQHGPLTKYGICFRDSSSVYLLLSNKSSVFWQKVQMVNQGHRDFSVPQAVSTALLSGARAPCALWGPILRRRRLATSLVPDNPAKRTADPSARLRPGRTLRVEACNPR